MDALFEQNRQLRKFYCLIAQIIGWLVLLMGAGGFALSLVWTSLGKDQTVPKKMLLIMSEHSWFAILLTGLAALGLVQFIRYLFEGRYQPGWILRYADKLLYLCAAIVIIKTVGLNIRMLKFVDLSYFHFNPLPVYRWLLYTVLPSSLLAVTRLLILLGLAQVLRRLIPVIRESKTPA